MIIWSIYAISDDSGPIYIGMTAMPERRRKYHLWGRFRGRGVRFDVLCCAVTEQDAAEVEAALIFKHRPRLNIAHSIVRPPVVQYIDTTRRAHGQDVPFRMRLREGEKHPGTMAEKLALMGWSQTRAYQMFGSFGAGAAIMERARAKRRAKYGDDAD